MNHASPRALREVFAREYAAGPGEGAALSIFRRGEEIVHLETERGRPVSHGMPVRSSLFSLQRNRRVRRVCCRLCWKKEEDPTP